MPVLSNPRHELFAQELARGKSATEAYELAGYEPNDGNASRLKGNERISARVDEILGRAAERVEIDRAWVLERLIENANRAMQTNPVLDHDGEITGEYRYEGSVANRALELVGKELGMFVERKEVGKPGDFDEHDAASVRDSIARDLEALGRQDLAAALIGGNGEAGRKPH